ncbi:MAG: ferric reductase-like transmembrane domain-containing protein [Dysgonamonadaceae bacterium]|jgi:DMSO/TMAO reductase YedYZ heme-binding membrane subunit|nr:ferric reductase-like transmembrane domain-containing protein [Dysgonamonadaceae bacterium]
MIKLLFDFIQFLNTVAPLLLSVAVLTLLALLLSKSIKRHATVYYIVMAIPFALVAIPFIGRLLEIEMYNFNRIPLLGGILRDYIHMGTLGFPLLVIIMYMGALNPKNSHVKKLLGIRKELSILSGFPILTHSLIRVTNNFPNALRFFTDNEGYMATTKVTSELGAGITNFSFVLGILMLALFIPLWITSFDAIHKRMGNVKWKKFQRWSYVLYATLFIHAMGIQAGAWLNPREREAPKPVVEVTAKTDMHNHENSRNPELQGRTEKGERGDKNAVQTADKRGNRAETARPAGSGRPQSLGFADINVGSQTKRYIHIASLLLIFGSYLPLRLRKAKKVSGKQSEG